MKTAPLGMADRLLADGGQAPALKRVKEELAQARRSRSRYRYAYWAAVEAALREDKPLSAAPAIGLAAVAP